MVAPLTASMSALCLARAPARSCGSAAALMATDLGSSPGSCSAVDPGDRAAGDRDADLGAAVLVSIASPVAVWPLPVALLDGGRRWR
jgi:hypothetical protein